MKRMIVAGIFLWANVAGPAMADLCQSLKHGGDLPATGSPSVTSVLTGNYSCYNKVSLGNSGTRENNETLIGGGQFQEYHHGGATVETEGPYSITTGTDSTVVANTNAGIITYTYNSNPPGNPYAYYICSGTFNATPYGTGYYFINTATHAVLRVAVSSTPGTC